MDLQIWLPYKDFFSSISILAPQQLKQARLSSYSVLRLLQRNRQSHYQLSGGPKGTIIQQTNGTVVNGDHPAVGQWSNNELSLVIYYKITLIVCHEQQINNSGFCVSSSSFLTRIMKKGLYSDASNPKWLTTNYCISQQEELFAEDFSFYSKKFKNTALKIKLEHTPQEGVDIS